MCFRFHSFFLLCFCLCLFSKFSWANIIRHSQEVSDFHVGVVLDMDSSIGKIGWSCIELALMDFYALHINYRSRLILHLRDSQGDNVQASLAVIDLLQNVEVQVIIGPQTSRQSDFAVDFGDKAHVPIVSFSATSPSLSFRTPYFVRAAASDSSQVKAITAIIQSFKWREVVTIYEDSDFGKGIIPFLVDALHVEQVKVPYESVIPLSATDDKIRLELYKLMNMGCRVFIVHMSYNLGSRFFLLVKELGMNKGYVWIITDGLTNLLDSMNTTVMASMQGVLGVKPYIERSPALDLFTDRWNRGFQQDLNIYGLWAYDSIWTLAMAAERVGPPKFLFKNTSTNDLTDLTAIKTSKTGPKLLQVISKTRFRGLSGNVSFVNGQLQSDIFQVLNVIGNEGKEVGFWTSEHGLSKQLNKRNDGMYQNSVSNLSSIIWPGGSSVAPKCCVIPVNGKKLRIGVPVRPGFDAFVRVNHDSYTNMSTISGYSIDVFKLVMAALPYPVEYEFVPYMNANGSSAGSHSDLIYQVYLQKYDAVVGDTTITARRSLFVDFTLPYAEGGVSMMVPVKDEKKGYWVFFQPLTRDLWLISWAFFIMTGAVVWALEHRVNEAFRGPPSQHVPLILWFPLSTFVFAHRERIVSNLTRFVVAIWIFVILILNSSYTASLSSTLTAQRLQPAVPSVEDLVKRGDYVGYQKGSFIPDVLKGMNFNESKLRPFNSQDEMNQALQKGSHHGGIAAFFSVVPYTKLFIAKYCNQYRMVGPISKTEGFGMAFARGSPLLGDVSRAMLKVIESSKMKQLELELYGIQSQCSESRSDDKPYSLNIDSFRGLFLITGSVSGLALLVFLIAFFYKNKQVWFTAYSNGGIWMKIKTILKKFDEKDLTSYRFRRKRSEELGEVTASPSSTIESEFRDMHASPNFTGISGVRDMEASPSFTNISDVRYMEASPSFTNVLTFTDGNHSLFQGMVLFHADDIRINSIVLEEFDDIGLSD